MAIVIDDFKTAGHRFDEFGVCVEPVPEYHRVRGIERCPVHWDDIMDIDNATTATGSWIWVAKSGVAHDAHLTQTEITEIMKRKAMIVRKCCIATGWRVPE